MDFKYQTVKIHQNAYFLKVQTRQNPPEPSSPQNMLFAITGLLTLNLGLLAQAFVPLSEGRRDETEKVQAFTNASTSALAYNGKK
jgi:hypothetical protein